MEARFQIDDKLFDRVSDRTDIDKASELGRKAFELLDWATAEAQAGRKVISVDSSGQNIHTPIMDIIQPQYIRW